MIHEKAVQSMKSYFAGNDRMIDHTLKVLSYAEQILKREDIQDGFVRDVLIMSAIYHDIGIPEAIKKYGSSAAEYQEKEGHPIARKLMRQVGVRTDILERVCYIVGNHHSREKVDGIDFQILWEADCIVNIEENNITVQRNEIPEWIQENFKTPLGKKLISEHLQT